MKDFLTMMGTLAFVAVAVSMPNLLAPDPPPPVPGLVVHGYDLNGALVFQAPVDSTPTGYHLRWQANRAATVHSIELYRGNQPIQDPIILAGSGVPDTGASFQAGDYLLLDFTLGK